jgi:holo-[acyl-carrier protein] synthase
MSLPESLIQAAAGCLLADVAGVGIDVVDIDLLQSLVTQGGRSFIDAYWAPAEQLATGNQIERLAGRWAAKEAVMKSLGHGVGDLDPIDIEIAAHSSGAPHVVLHRDAARLAAEAHVSHCHVSITHESSWAAAIALAVKA